MAAIPQPLSHQSFDSVRSAWRFLKHELAPTPERFSISIRVTIAAVIITLVGEAARSASLFAALFILLSLPRGTPKQTWVATRLILLTCIGASIFSFALDVLVADLRPLRVFAVGGAVFLAMIVGRGLRQPLVGTLTAVLSAQGLIQWDTAPSPDVAIDFILWFTLMVAFGSLTATALEYLYPHPSATDRIVPGITERLRMVQAVLRQASGESLDERDQRRAEQIRNFALSGAASLRSFLPGLTASELPDKTLRNRLAALVNDIEPLLDLAAQLRRYSSSDFDHPQQQCFRQLARRCQHLEESVGALKVELPAPSGESEIDSLGDPLSVAILPQIAFLLDRLWQAWYHGRLGGEPEDSSPSLPQKVNIGPFFTADNVHFAFKIALATTICYAIYTGVDWPGISTSLITCFIISLDSVGATFRKAALRLIGVFIGGLLFGILGIAFILSNSDNVVELALVVAVVFFIAGWVVNGSQRISYAGVQIGLSFALVALNQPTIPNEIAQARDRFAGVLLGVIVMWFVFRQLWPVSAVTLERSHIARLLRGSATLLTLTQSDEPAAIRSKKVDRLRADGVDAVFQAKEQADSAGFDSQYNATEQASLHDCLECAQATLLLSLVEADFSVTRPKPHHAESLGEIERHYSEMHAAYLTKLADEIVQIDRGSVSVQPDENLNRLSLDLTARLESLAAEHDQETQLYARTRMRLAERDREARGKLTGSIQALADYHTAASRS